METLANPLQGFDSIERLLERARKHAAAGTKEDLLEVGRLSEQVVIELAHELYRPAVHEPRQGPKPGASPKRRLDAYIDVELSGQGNLASRALAKSALESADSLQQLGTDDYKSAALCLQATTSLVGVLRIAAGAETTEYTVAELIARFLDSRKLGSSHRYTLERLARSELAKKSASKITADDLIEHCRARRQTAQAATVMHDVVGLRGVFNTAKTVWNLNVALGAFDEAKRWLTKLQLVGISTPRTRRPTGEELDKLLDFLEKQDSDPRTKIFMRDLVLFALYSGLRRGEICALKWSDLDRENRTCKVPGVREPVKIVSPAWEIIERQRKRSLNRDRIFPYNDKSAGARYTLAKKHLGIENLRFNDLRREAAIRLYYKEGYSVEDVSKIVGRMDLNTLNRDIAQAAPDFANREEVNLTTP